MRLAWLALLAACGDDAHPLVGDATLAVGADRFVLVHAPLRPGPAPLVLALHASGADAAGMQQAMGLDSLADRYGYLVAYPQGVLPWESGFEWNIPGVPLASGEDPPATPDDIAYLVAAIDAIDARYSIDRARIYATGISGGARMASQLGCDVDLVAAVAPIAGLRYPAPCLARPESVIAFHGDADTTNPYGGNGSPYWTYSVPDAIAGWATQEHCAAEVDTMVAPTVVRSDFPSCAGGALVRLYTLGGEGHAFPIAIDANATMLAAFALVQR